MCATRNESKNHNKGTDFFDQESSNIMSASVWCGGAFVPRGEGSKKRADVAGTSTHPQLKRRLCSLTLWADLLKTGSPSALWGPGSTPQSFLRARPADWAFSALGNIPEGAPPSRPKRPPSTPSQALVCIQLLWSLLAFPAISTLEPHSPKSNLWRIQ